MLTTNSTYNEGAHKVSGAGGLVGSASKQFSAWPGLSSRELGYRGQASSTLGTQAALLDAASSAAPDYRCCAAGILRAARPREKKEKRAKRIRHEADWREGGAPPLTPPHTRDREAGQAWDDVDIIIRLPNSNIASTGVGECCAARSFVCVGQQGNGKLIQMAVSLRTPLQRHDHHMQ